MFEIPTFLSYPKIEDISKRPEMIGITAYITHLQIPGYAILIKLKNNEVGVVYGDWNGNKIDDHTIIDTLYTNFVTKLVPIMKATRFDLAQYFIADDSSLVDVQLSLGKFLSPGMIKDLFSKQVGTQKLIELAPITKEKIVEIKTDKSKYPANVIIKPNRYRAVGATPSTVAPCYAIIR